MPTIKKINRAGWVKRKDKINEIIDELEPLLNITIQYSTQSNNATVKYSTGQVLITLPDLQPQINSLNARVAALED